MTHPLAGRRVLALLVLALTPVVGPVVGYAQRLEVVRDSGEVLLTLELAHSLAHTARWQVVWHHSVTGMAVSDHYRVEGEQMMLEASHTPDFAAGLGHIPGRGRLESDGAGGYWVRGIDEPVAGNRYLLRVGSPRVDHRLCHLGTCHSLSRRVAGERVTIRLEPQPAEGSTP